MNFSEMKAQVLDLIAEENNDRFDDDFVGRAVNLGAIDFIDKTEVLDSYWSISTVANQMWYLVPTATFEITRVEWVDATDDERHKLEKKTFKEMDEEYPYDTDRTEEDTDWQEITGDPVVWIPREHDVIGIYPACDVNDDTLYIYGRKKHTTLTGTNTSAIPVEFHNTPCLYAARMLLRSDNDEKAPNFEKWYKEEVMIAKREIKDRKKKHPAVWRVYTY